MNFVLRLVAFALLVMVLMAASCRANRYIINDDAVPTVWYITQVNGKAPARSTMSAGRPFIVLNYSDSSVRGNSGCNAILGKFSTSGKNHIHFYKVRLTLLNCDTAYETGIENGLNSTSQYRRKRSALYLLDEKGKVVMELRQ
jgi:heat shock protein HslJ